MLWQTRTLASFIAATVPVQEGETTSKLLENAQSIGEGILLDNKSKEEEELYLGKYKFNSYESVMDVFSGQGSVRLNQAG